MVILSILDFKYWFVTPNIYFMINIKLTMTDKAMDTVTKQVIILVYAIESKELFWRV